MSDQLADVKKIHPGYILAEQLEAENMTRHDLSVRTGVSEKHISTVLAGLKGISVSFAKKLDYALEPDASFWINKQSDYDFKIAEIEEQNNINNDEKKVLKNLKDIIEYYIELGLISKNNNDTEKIIQLRKLMRVTNLLSIPDISYDAAYRAQIRKNTNIDPYVLYAWQRTCELLTKDMEVAGNLNIELLKNSIEDMKKLMFEDINSISKKLTDIFAKCGIAFKIVRNFVGATVQGFIQKLENDRIILCITLRGKKADRFWFTLFHEVGHIINEDYNVRFVDVKNEGSPIELKADLFAKNCLLDENEYRKFLFNNDFTLEAIKRFSKDQGVRTFVVIGRLNNDDILEWGSFDSEIDRYEWAVA